MPRRQAGVDTTREERRCDWHQKSASQGLPVMHFHRSHLRAVWSPGRGEAWLILDSPPPAPPLVLMGQELASRAVFCLLSLICPSSQHPRAATVGMLWALRWAVVDSKGQAEQLGNGRQCGGCVVGEPHRNGGVTGDGTRRLERWRSKPGKVRGGEWARLTPGQEGRVLDGTSKGRVGPRVRRRPLRSSARGGGAFRAHVGSAAFILSAGEPLLCFCQVGQRGSQACNSEGSLRLSAQQSTGGGVIRMRPSLSCKRGQRLGRGGARSER